MARGPFPNKNVDVNGYFNTVQPYLVAHQVRFKISGADITTLTTIYTNVAPAIADKGWVELWVIYENPGLVNKTVRDEVRLRREQMEDQLRLIYDDIPKSVLTNQDRNTLNLPLRDTEPTTIQAVDFAPDITFEKVDNNIQLLRFQNPETPDSNAMPPNQSVALYMFLGAADLADNDLHFHHKADTGKHLHQVDFAPNKKGQTAYYRARYKTDTGKTGPWSDVQSELVL